MSNTYNYCLVKIKNNKNYALCSSFIFLLSIISLILSITDPFTITYISDVCIFLSCMFFILSISVCFMIFKNNDNYNVDPELMF